MIKLIPKGQRSLPGGIRPLSEYSDRMSSTDTRSDHQKSQQLVLLEHQAAQAQRVRVALERAESRNKRNERLLTTVRTNFEGEPVTETDYNANNLGAGLETTGPEKWFLEYLLGKPLFEGASLATRYAGAKFGGLSAFGHWSRNSLLALNPGWRIENLAATEPLLNVGWAPKLTIAVSHAKTSSSYPSTYYAQRWDVVNEGANPFGVWLLGKLGTPRTNITNPGKGVKATKARAVFASRPYNLEGEVTLSKPLVTIGDVPSRAKLSYDVERMGGDGIIYNNVYDNGYNNNLVILSQVEPLWSKMTNRRPTTSNISTAERLGIPKADRHLMTQDLNEAVEDLMQYVRSGQNRQVFRVNPEDEVYWGTKSDANPTFALRVAELGVPQRRPEAFIRAGADNGVITWFPNKNLAGYSSRMFKGDFGEANMFVDGVNGNKLILTAPRTDAEEGILEEGIDLSHLPRTIDKNIMKDFWVNVGKTMRPGSYTSGDNGKLPLGSQLILQFKNSRFKVPFDLNYKSKNIYRSGLSPDSYSAIIRLALRDGNSLRWGEGFTKWNNSAIENAHIYDLYTKYKNKEITAELYKKAFDEWALPLGGKEATILRIPEKIEHGTDNLGNAVSRVIPAKENVIIPHPYIYRKKFGGKL